MSRNGNRSNLSQLVHIDVERRKFRLMFGDKADDQFVMLRSDGLRRRNFKRKLDIENTVDTVAEQIPTNSESLSNLSMVINEVASGDPTTVIDCDQTLLERPHSVDRWEKINSERSSGNRQYHPPGKYHGSSTMVEHKKRWTYRMACDINAAEQDPDGQMYYVADPFLPMPRSRQGLSTAERMSFAAQRLDNRKFRNQISTVKSIAENESATCEKCGMRFFLPAMQMQQRISYLLPAAEEELPTVLFQCPVCETTSKAEVYS